MSAVSEIHLLRARLEEQKLRDKFAMRVKPDVTFHDKKLADAMLEARSQS